MFALNWFTGFRGKFLNIFPIGPHVKTMFADGGHLEYPIGKKKHNFCRGPYKDHPCNVCFKLVYWFQRRKFLNNFPIGSYVKTMPADSGHLEYQIGKKNITFVEVHPVITHAKNQFNLLCTFFKG